MSRLNILASDSISGSGPVNKRIEHATAGLCSADINQALVRVNALAGRTAPQISRNLDHTMRP